MDTRSAAVIDHPQSETRQLAFERMLGGLLARFVAADAASMPNELEHAMRVLIEFLDYDRCSYFTFESDTEEPITVTSVALPGVAAFPRGPFRLPFDWLIAEIRAGRVVNLSSEAALPAGAMGEREYMQRTGLRATLVIPISARSQVVGAIAFGAHRSPRKWPLEWVSRLTMVGNVIAEAVRRQRLEIAREELIGFESLVRRVSVRLAKASGAQAGAGVELGLAQVAAHFGAERCVLSGLSAGAQQVPFPPVAVNVPETASDWVSDHARWFPWEWERLQADEAVLLRTLEDYPSDAEVDHNSARALGHRSRICIPIALAGESRLAMVLLNATVDGKWLARCRQQLQLLGETLAAARVRGRAEEALRETAQRLADAEVVGRLGTWVRHFDSGRIEASGGIANVLGRPLSTASQLSEITDPEDRRAVEAELLRARKDFAAYKVDYRVVSPDGTRRMIRERGKCLAEESGSSRRAVGTVQDITAEYRAELDTRRLRMQLWHADRLASTGTLTASIAHELNQPLAAILANAQAGLRFLRAGESGLDEIRPILEDIVRDDKRASEIIGGLRALVRREAPERERLDVVKVLQGLIALLHSEIVLANVHVVVELHSNCHVLANRTQLQQVLMNLVLNALDAMRSVKAERRNLRVIVARRGDGEVEVVVSDHGIGVAPDQMDRLFDPFFTTKAHGMGLGLAVCRAIVEAHGGTIRALPGSDNGMTFTFVLPAADTSPGPVDERH